MSSSSIRVLMLIRPYRPTYTGMGIQVEELGRRLGQHSIDATVICGAVDGAPSLEPESVPPVIRTPLPGTKNQFRAWHTSSPVKQHLKEGRFHILHSFGFVEQLPFLVHYCRRNNIRTIMTGTLLDGDDPHTLQRGRLGWFRHQVFKRIDAYTMLAPALANRFPLAGLDTSNVSVIPPGIDVDQFPFDRNRDDLARELGWDADSPRALFAGAVLHRKGVDLLLDAWAGVLDKVPQAKLYIAGPHRFENPEWSRFVQAMKDTASQPRLRDSVSFLGRIDDRQRLANMYRAAHVFTFPTRSEGFGIVIAEALAAGTPTVVTELDGITDYNMVDGKTGYVVPQKNIDAFAEKTVALLGSASSNREMADFSREFVESRFSLAHVTQQYADFYRRLLNGERVTGGTFA